MMTDECVDMLVMKLTQMRLKVKRRRCLFYKHSTMLAAKNKLRSRQYACIDQHFRLRYVVARCGALRNVEARCGALRHVVVRYARALRCVTAVRYGVLRCVVACCSALRYAAMRCGTLWHLAGRCGALRNVASPCGTLQHVAVR